LTPFWHPLSALLFGDPPVFASAFLLRRWLSKGKAIEVIYAGDRMWPAVRHGQTVRVEPLGDRRPQRGMAVVAAPSNIPDLLRVERVGNEAITLRGDADPMNVFTVTGEHILGRADIPDGPARSPARIARRLIIDGREALRGTGDPAPDAAETVRVKYETQSRFYLKGMPEDLPGVLLDMVRRHVNAGRRILVAGSGTGRECFSLAENGYTATGVDFSPSMVELARQEARKRGLAVEFRQADLRLHEEPPSSLNGILFTFNVYSFIPVAADRISLLRRMGAWLKPGGAVFLSARRVRGFYDRAILTLEWLGSGSRGPSGWGASHTRWIAPDGTLHRSFVFAFTEKSIRREIESAGFRTEPWEGGHRVLLPAPRPDVSP